ncbi:hypothetical protein [Halorarius litoreus]|uniref:hypothetical protein n=1 Tax=Halorarius litoreus TaxID=2962676 RepID=UPI0020CF54D8|nr:hypothetical protein [Halorarius litoreus]
MTERVTGPELLDRLDGDTCTRESCSGRLERRPYKDTRAVVCADCSTPVFRVWNP